MKLTAINIQVQDFQVIQWKEVKSNNYKKSQNHQAGEKEASVTGVTWLTESILIAANHRSGKIIFFNTNQNEKLGEVNLYTQTDDVCAIKNGSDFLINCSAAWSGEQVLICGKTLDKGVQTGHPKIVEAIDKSYSHSVFFKDNIPSIAFQAGEFPRIQIGNDILTLPPGYLPASAFWSQKKNCLFICSNYFNQNRRQSTSINKSSVWKFDAMTMYTPRHEMSINQCQIDKCQIRNNFIWFNNRHTHSIVGINLSDYNNQIILKNSAIDSPRGIAINSDGIMAVANHSRNYILLFNLDELIKGMN
ncbi:hypothetical protein [Synechococcus sp. MIT S1220]|uniref:hypothetical protein n=1 Tax=Synechococcus sp. MIT S1220 TaxID=3082549 RepID=UPI0039B07B7C